MRFNKRRLAAILGATTLSAIAWLAVAQRSGVVKPGMNDTIRVHVYVDNWFLMYINGKLVTVDPIDFLPHNEVSVDILPEYPMTIAVLAKDNADPKTGMEYGNHVGDAGMIVKFADGTVTNAAWKTKVLFSGPLGKDTRNPKVVEEPAPDRWYAPEFDDSGWKPATEYPAGRVRADGNYSKDDFTGAKFIWSGELDLENTVLFRYRVEKPDVKQRWNTKPDLDNTCVFFPLDASCRAIR